MLGYLSFGRYLFLVAHSFPRALLSETISLLGTDNVRGQISEHIFAPNGDYCSAKNLYKIILSPPNFEFANHMHT